MPDFKFQVERIRFASVYKAMRQSVFYSTIGNMPSIPESLEKLRKLWKLRLISLKKAGWNPVLVHGKSNQYMRNCPPFGVKTDTTARCCNRPLVCPFCWAREYTEKGFRHLQTALFGGTDPKAKPQGGYFLIETHLKRIITSTNKIWTPDFLGNYIMGNNGKLKEVMKEERREDVDKLKTKSAIVMYRFDLQDKSVILHRGTLGLTRCCPGKLPDIPKDRKLSYWGKSKYAPNKHDLIKSCKRIFTYPNSMMFGDVNFIVAFLNNVNKLRFFSAYGIGSKTTFGGVYYNGQEKEEA